MESASNVSLKPYAGDFQGPALVAILEGVSLNREEISSLQLLPPWRLRGNTLNYGLGLLSCFFICDLLSIISGGHFYMFDPFCLALGAPSSHAPAAKMFSLIGITLTIRFIRIHVNRVEQEIPMNNKT